MLMYELLSKKKTGGILTRDEIDFMIAGYLDGTIPDYQMSAMLMAIYFQGMSADETLYLTQAMASSGQMLDLSDIGGVKVDKHSSGGVGDKTSLVLAPIMAACGLKIAKMSGRGLGHTGGTIDKLGSIPGFRTDISITEFKQNIERIGMALMGQTAELAPADKLLYALRDVTATVDHIALIASSIMSKKLAAGADVLVLDVKCGSGAFMQQEADAYALATEMVQIGNGAGKKTIALVTDMDQPLGMAVGNALELKEALHMLGGKGPADLWTVCLAIMEQMLVGSGQCATESAAKSQIEKVVANGLALQKMAEFVAAQGGDADYVYHPEKLPAAAIISPVLSQESAYISRIACDEVGRTSLILGGGRHTKDDVIDAAVGVVLAKKVGERVARGEVLAYVHGNDEAKANEARERLLSAYSFSDEPPQPPVLIKKVFSAPRDVVL